MSETNEKVFEAYFSGQLNKAEKEAFEARLANNNELNQEFQFFFAIKKATHLKGRDIIREELASVQETPKTNTKVISLVKKVIPVAAILILTFIAYKVYIPELEPSEQYAKYFESYTPSVNRSEEKQKESIHKYENGDFQGYLNLTEKIQGDPEVYLLQAMSWIELQNYENAQNQLLLISDGSALRNQKYWYLGLVAMKRNKPQEAIQYFEQLQKLSNYKKVNVRDLLDILKNQ